MCRKILCLFALIATLLCFCVVAQAEETGIQKLSADVDGLVIDTNTVLDLNGFRVTNATVAEGVTLQLMDSANDTYDASQCGSFSGTVHGTVTQLVKHDAKSYLVVEENGVYSAHRFYAGITHISLAPNQAGLGYKAQFHADEVIKPMVQTCGYRLQVNDYAAKEFTQTGMAKEELALRIKNILQENDPAQNAIGVDAQIHAQAFITFADVGTVQGAKHSTTLKQAVETVNSTLGAAPKHYTLEQVLSARALYCRFDGEMSDWQVENILAKFLPMLPKADFLYRVGSRDAIALDTLVATMTDKPVTVTVTTDGGNATGTYSAGTVKFNNTGLVTLSLCEEGDTDAYTLQLEIVDGYNVTDFSQLKNRSSVLLRDIVMSEGSTYSLTNGTLHGNNFTIDARNAAYQETASGTTAESFVINLANAKLDNVRILGAVYSQYGDVPSKDYNRALVLVNGNSAITNCYLTNTASPVRITNGKVLIAKTTLQGGNYANLDIRNGNIILDGVTTINQLLGNDHAPDGTVVVGLGIVFFHEQVLDTTTLEIRNGLTQYNTFSQTQAYDAVVDGNCQKLVTAMFHSSNAAVQFQDDQGELWVNAGILSMNEVIRADHVTGLTGYTGKETSLLGSKGYVLTKVPVLADTTAEPLAYTSAGQYAITPAYKFDYTTKNYLAKTEDSNDFCYYNNGVVMIGMDAGDSFLWDTAILTPTKNGQTLPYTVTMDGVDYTGKKIAFNTAGNYTVTYTYTDPNNYCLDVSGQVNTYPVTYTQTVQLQVAVMEAEAKHAEFTFGTNDTKFVTVGNNTYVMPNVTGTSTTVSSVTVSGTTVYCPVVEAYTTDGKYSHSSLSYWNMCFPVFANVVTIRDYEGDTVVSYDASTQSLPAGLTVNNPAATFQYSASATAATEPVVHKNVLVYQSPRLSNNERAETYVTARYQYIDNAGATYYYYVKYHCPAHTVDNGCVTADALVTLADGTQKQIRDVTYNDQLLVWDFYKGEYAAAPSAIIFRHGYGDNTVIKLNFSDGTSVKVVNLHQFLDGTENRFVTIDARSVANYVGHEFVNSAKETVTLVDYTVTQEYVEAYGIISAGHYNIFVNGMLSTDFMKADCDLFQYFSIGKDMQFDQAAMAADIAAYGLYTYEDFSHVLSYEQFIAFNVQYFKIPVGKGLYTYESILDLIETYL